MSNKYNVYKVKRANSDEFLMVMAESRQDAVNAYCDYFSYDSGVFVAEATQEEIDDYVSIKHGQFLYPADENPWG